MLEKLPLWATKFGDTAQYHEYYSAYAQITHVSRRSKRRPCFAAHLGHLRKHVAKNSVVLCEMTPNERCVARIAARKYRLQHKTWLCQEHSDPELFWYIQTQHILRVVWATSSPVMILSFPISHFPTIIYNALGENESRKAPAKDTEYISKRF